MDPLQAVRTVINTLGQVEVRGRANLDYLLGAIVLLEKAAAEMQRRTDTKEDEAHGESV